MVVKDKKKFIRGIILILTITIALVLLMTNVTLSHQEIKYKKVSVVSGDTLWKIAEKEQNKNAYYKNKDVRDIIEDIKEKNNLETSSLKVNQALEIPIY